MSNDADRSHATGVPHGPVGRKDIADYSSIWGMAALVATVVLIAAVVIFSAAGSDRTRTAAYNNLHAKSGSQHSQTPGSRAPAAKIPDQDMPTAPR